MKRATWADVVLTIYLLVIVNIAITGFLVHNAFHVIRKRLTSLGRCD